VALFAASASAEEAVDPPFKAPDHVSLTNAQPGGSPLLPAKNKPKGDLKAEIKADRRGEQRAPPQGPLQSALSEAGFGDGIPVGAHVSNTVEADGTVNIVVDMPDGGTRVIRQGPSTGQQTLVLRTN